MLISLLQELFEVLSCTWISIFFCNKINVLFKIFIHLKDGDRELSSAGSLSKCLQKLGLGHAKVRSWELSPGLQHGWQEHKHLRHHLLSPRKHFSRKLELETDPGLNLGITGDVGVPSSMLPNRANTCLETYLSFVFTFF